MKLEIGNTGVLVFMKLTSGATICMTGMIMICTAARNGKVFFGVQIENNIYFVFLAFVPNSYGKIHK